MRGIILRALFLIGLASTFLSLSLTASDNVDKDRRIASDKLAREISNLQVHKIYVADFLDAAGNRTDKGCYFASVFSANLKKQGKGIDVLNSAEVQKILDTAGMKADDFQKPETMSRISKEIGVDAVVLGTVALSTQETSLALSLREAATGRELYQFQYEEPRTSNFEALFPATSDSSGRIFYFSGLNGVTIPKCVSCSQPSYTDTARRKKIQGSVIWSAIVLVDGSLADLRIVQSLEPSLDEAAYKEAKRWKLNPARDAQGNVVTVRVGIETTFRFY
jgi:TonB family protein